MCRRVLWWNSSSYRSYLKKVESKYARPSRLLCYPNSEDEDCVLVKSDMRELILD